MCYSVVYISLPNSIEEDCYSPNYSLNQWSCLSSTHWLNIKQLSAIYHTSLKLVASSTNESAVTKRPMMKKKNIFLIYYLLGGGWGGLYLSLLNVAVQASMCSKYFGLRALIRYSFYFFDYWCLHRAARFV